MITVPDPLAAVVRASQAGRFFRLYRTGGEVNVFMTHVFAAPGGAIAFVDGNWGDGYAPGHVVHVLEGEVLHGDPAAPDLAFRWQHDGKVLTIFPYWPDAGATAAYARVLAETGRIHAQDRAMAKLALEGWLGVGISA